MLACMLTRVLTRVLTRMLACVLTRMLARVLTRMLLSRFVVSDLTSQVAAGQVSILRLLRRSGTASKQGLLVVTV